MSGFLFQLVSPGILSRFEVILMKSGAFVGFFESFVTPSRRMFGVLAWLLGPTSSTVHHLMTSTCKFCGFLAFLRVLTTSVTYQLPRSSDPATTQHFIPAAKPELSRSHGILAHRVPIHKEDIVRYTAQKKGQGCIY